MKKLSYKEIRDSYTQFMITKGHKKIENVSLLPENDPSVLYVTAGMFPLVPFLLGETHPLGTRLTNVQRCLRTDDIEEVGDDSHCTAFEMIGSWSLNDYFKKDALENWFEFLIKHLGYDIKNLYATVFQGDKDAPKDTESVDILKNIFSSYGIDAKEGDGERIRAYDKKKNWWGLATGGPCGPTSELFYDTGKEPCGKDCHINCDCGKYVELGNNVFMEYLLKDGKYLPLGRHNVDFGGGLERLTIYSQNVKSFYDTDIYLPLLKYVQSISSIKNQKAERVVVDHIKSATWLCMDGVTPGRTQQSYILRRLIRRAVRYGNILGIEKSFTEDVAKICIEQFKDLYPKLKDKENEIISIISNEEKKFRNTLRDGLKIIEKYIKSNSPSEIENSAGETAFKLYESYGIPFEMFIEELNNASISIDKDKIAQKFNAKQSEHQELSRTASKGLFKGGLADTSDTSKKYHTTTHLLLAALRKTLGGHVYQKGSNITTERLRFDFPNENKLTDEQIKEVEDEINLQIKNALPVSFKEMPKEEGRKIVPTAVFDEKYGDIVKVYFIGDPTNPYSAEFCNGPHVNNTSEIGGIKILKQENVGAGVKRIKAVLT